MKTKQISKVFIGLIVLAVAAFALYYFYSHKTTEIETPVAGEFMIENVELKKDIIDDDDIGPIAISGADGLHLEFVGTKLGTTVGRASISFVDRSGEYEIKANARATGMLNQIFHDRMQFRATGKQNGVKMTVQHFNSTTVKDDNKKTKKEKIHIFDRDWKYTKYGKDREVDAKIFDHAADPLTLLFHIGRTIDTTGKCNLEHNGFMDETGFSVIVMDKGQTKDSGITRAKKKITETRCDLVLKNRAGKVVKDYPFEHEFAKKKAKKRASVISVYYSKLNGENYIPVFIIARETPIGEIKVKLNKISK